MLSSSTQPQNRSFHVVERTRTSSKCQKMTNARAKRAKILFFFVKYANLWGLCCRRRLGCLSSLVTFIPLQRSATAHALPSGITGSRNEQFHCRASGDVPHQKHSNTSLQEMGIVKSRLTNTQSNKVRIFPDIHRIVQTAKKCRIAKHVLGDA